MIKKHVYNTISKAWNRGYSHNIYHSMTSILVMMFMLVTISSTAIASAEVIDDGSLDLIARTYDEYDWMFQTSINMEGTNDTIYDFTLNGENDSVAIRIPPYQVFLGDWTGNNRQVIFRFTGKQADNSSVPSWVYLTCGSNFEYMIDITQSYTYDDNRFYYISYQLDGTDGDTRYSTCRIVTEKDVQIETIFTVKDSIYGITELEASESVLVCQKKTVNSWLVIVQKVSQYLMNLVALVYYVTITVLLILVKYIFFPALLLAILIGVRFLSKRLTSR